MRVVPTVDGVLPIVYFFMQRGNLNYTCVVLLTEVMRLERHYLHSLAPGFDKDAVLQDIMKTYTCCNTADERMGADRIFMVNGIQMLGHEGKFGIRKMNRTQDQAFLISKAGYHVEIYFWGDKGLFNTKYKLTATKKDTNKTIALYEWPITLGSSSEVGADAQSGAKFGIDEPGLWRLDVSVNDIPFDSVIVDVKEPAATRKSS
jgi:hypothetical protein